MPITPWTTRALTLPGCLIAAGLLAACNLTSSSDDDSSSAAVETTEGAVEGFTRGDHTAFQGIPYAEPPEGTLRFQPPQPPKERVNTLEATDFGDSCPQPGGVFGSDSVTEDCLYLNVYTPSADADERPVMVWIHGGAFETGSGNDYSPDRLVDDEDLVVVTINYRLGLLGFLAHPALDDSGNYGLMDQIAALEWVQDNIHAFGGDPENVTIFGESAGGHSVLSLFVSPETRHLFDRIIVQSGSYEGGQQSLSDGESQGESTMAELGCDNGSTDCLRDLDAADIVALQNDEDLSFIPKTGTSLLPDSINTAIDAGDHASVPVLAGTNRDEWRLFVGIDLITTGEPTPEHKYEPAIQATLSVDAAAAEAIADEYPPGDFGDSADLALGAVGTSAIFACPALGHAGQLAQSGTQVYVYEFTDQEAPPLFDVPGFPMGAAHAFEIQYIFNSESYLREELEMDDAQVDLANAMMRYWASFAQNGDPNPTQGDLPFWSDFASGDMLELGTPAPTTLSVSDFSDIHRCTFWSGL